MEMERDIERGILYDTAHIPAHYIIDITNYKESVEQKMSCRIDALNRLIRNKQHAEFEQHLNLPQENIDYNHPGFDKMTLLETAAQCNDHTALDLILKSKHLLSDTVCWKACDLATDMEIEKKLLRVVEEIEDKKTPLSHRFAYFVAGLITSVFSLD